MTAIRPRIADQFVPLIESLGKVEGPLSAKAEQTIGMTLQLGEVVELGRLHPLSFGREGLDDRFPRTGPKDDVVGFLAIGWQSREVHLGVVVLVGLCSWTEPCPLIALLVRILPSLKCRDHLEEVFGDKAPESEFPIHNHGQGRRLHSSDRKLLTVDNRIGTRQIHANQPIGSASATGGVSQSIILTAGTKVVEPLADGIGGQ